MTCVHLPFPSQIDKTTLPQTQMVSKGMYLATMATDGINLVDEYNAGRVATRLRKQITHTRRSHSHKHFLFGFPPPIKPVTSVSNAKPQPFNTYFPVPPRHPLKPMTFADESAGHTTKSEPEMEKNGTPASPATAFPSKVLPVPGGPTNSAPYTRNKTST